MVAAAAAGSVPESRSRGRLAFVIIVWGIFALSSPAMLSGSTVGLLGAVVVALAYFGGLRNIKLPASLLVLVAMMWISVLWSAYPTRSIQATAIMTLAAVGAGMVAGAISLGRAIAAIETVSLVIVAVSLVLFVVSPETAIEHRAGSAGTLIGIYTQKNVLGTVINIGFTSRLYRKGSGALVNLSALMVYVVAAYLAQSSTTWIILFLGTVLRVAVWLIYRHEARMRVTLIALLSPIIAVVIIGATYNLSTVLGVAGRDTTFSDRIPIWHGAIAAIREHPWFGYGWGAPFAPGARPAQLVFQYAEWAAPSAHDGLLMLLLQIGILGAIFGVAAMIFVSAAAVRALGHLPGASVAWLLGIMVVAWGNNVLDSRFQGSVWFIIVIVGAFALELGPRSSLSPLPSTSRAAMADGRRSPVIGV